MGMMRLCPIKYGGGIVRDPFADYVVSLLRFNGDFTDDTGLVYAINGTPTIETAQKQDGSGSMGRLTSGAGNYPYITNTGISFPSTTPFTFEFFIYPTSLYTVDASYNRILTIYNNYPSLLTGMQVSINGNTGRLDLGGGSIVGTQFLDMNAWNHIAFCSDGAATKLYANGILSASSTVATMVDLGWTIGGSFGFNGDFHTAYFDEFRCTIGVNRYSSDFTPPESFPPL
jgi:hypothetical protein